MTESLPCSECLTTVPGNFHCCIVCSSKKDALIEKYRTANEEQAEQILGLNRMLKKTLAELSGMIQGNLELKFTGDKQ